MSAQRPILFSAPMVRAILEGRKMVTRRVVKVQPRSKADIGSYGFGQPFIRNPDVTRPNPECPYGRPGERLWVRETFAVYGDQAMHVIHYRADRPWDVGRKDTGYKPSIHMPRWASRIFLEITDVRVERLQDISRHDIRAEGLECPPELASDDVSPNYRDWYPAAWRELWESINGAESWSLNPWVWVVEFKRVSP